MLNIGSIIKLEIINAEYISVSNPDGENKVTVSLNAEFNEIEFQQESASFNESEKQVIEGVLFESSLSFNIPKINPATISLLYNFINVPAVMRFTDGNGQAYIFGNNKVPLYILRSSAVPAKTSGLNGYRFNIKYKNPRPVPFAG